MSISDDEERDNLLYNLNAFRRRRLFSSGVMVTVASI